MYTFERESAVPGRCDFTMTSSRQQQDCAVSSPSLLFSFPNMAQKRPRADDSAQTPAPERYSRQRRSHNMRKLPPQKDSSTTETTNPLYTRLKSFATSIFTSGGLLSNFLSNSLADTSANPKPTLENGR